MDVPSADCLVVVDRLDTDVALGERAGMTTALVRTGVADHVHLVESDITPNYVSICSRTPRRFFRGELPPIVRLQDESRSLSKVGANPNAYLAIMEVGLKTYPVKNED